MAYAIKNLPIFQTPTVPSAAPYKFGIVVSEWNSAITNALYGGAYQSLIDHGALPDDIFTYAVPGVLS